MPDAATVLVNGPPLLMHLFRLAPNVKEDGTEKASTPLFAKKIDNESRAQDMLQNERAAKQALVTREGEGIED